MHPDELQSIPGLCDVIYGAAPLHAPGAASAIDAGLWPLVPVALWTAVILVRLLRNYSLRVHLHALAGLFSAMPAPARIGALFFSAICISSGLPKMNPLGGLLDGLISAPAYLSSPEAPAQASGPLTALTDAQTLAGSVLVAAGTNVSFTLDPPSNAVVHQPWVVRGAHADVFRCAPEGWSFLFGTNTYTNIYVSSSGTLALRRFQGSPDPVDLGDTSAFYLAPLQAAFGIAPAANWNLLSASNSLFWYDVTEEGAARFTWRNVLSGRSPESPVSFQAELLPSGDFTFRYDLGATPWPSNGLAGTRLNGGGGNALVDGCTATNHLCTSLYSLDGSNLVVTPLCAYLNGSARFALHWKAFTPADLGDPDSDGLDTADELLVYHTDPRNADSDGDGLLDGEEIGSGYDPVRFSTATNGVSDLLAVIDIASLTNASIRLGSGTSGTLVITSRLDTAASGDAAILRITLPGSPSAYIPVLPGTDIVTSVSLPIDTAVAFSLVATRETGISGTPVFGIGTDRPLILKDPWHLFDSAVQAMALTLPAASPSSYMGSVRFPLYSVLPASVCLHDPNLSFLTVSSPDNELMMLDSSGYPVYSMDVGWTWGELQAGANYHVMDIAFACTDPLARVIGGHKSRVHACQVPASSGGAGGEAGDGEEDLPHPCCDYSPCSHQYYGVPRSDDPDHPEETELPYNPVNKVLILNAAPENHHYGVNPEPTSGICPYCGHALESAGVNDYATVTYCSAELTAVPYVLRSTGEITVNGRSPSTNLWSSVLTIFHGTAYDMIRYTVLGCYPCERGKDEPATETWNIPCGATNAFDLHTDVLLQDGDVSVSLQGSGLLFARNRTTQALNLLCTTNSTFTMDVAQWRNTYCDTNRVAQAFLLCEASGAGTITHGYSHPQNTEVACNETLAFNAFRIELAADYADDGKIDDADRIGARNGESLRLWINDDSDVGDTTDEGGSDIPGQSSPDCGDDHVNGRRDLADLFPVLIDVTGLFDALGDDAVLCLSQGNSALRGIITPLDADHAEDFLTVDSDLYGAGRDQPSYDASAYPILAAGTTLPPAFVTRLRQDGKGVILIEGGTESSAPLVLKASQGGTNFSFSLPLRIAPVEQMMNRVDGRSLGTFTGYNGTSLPPSNGKHVIFLHGFHVDGDEARGWWAEMYKRLHRSGSRARFHGVTWFGNDGVNNGALNYHGNIVHAFATAPHLKDYVDTLTGDKIIMAHSLGNMVVSSAIADHNMQVHKYFMLNAAIPAEAFDAATYSKEDTNVLVHEDWTGYHPRTWASCYHELFTNSADERGKLTWVNRFTNVLARTTTYNYYSTGDEVFELYSGTPYSSSGIWTLFKRYAWHIQETHKGRGAFDPAGTSWAGWGFGNLSYIVYEPDPSSGLLLPYTRYYYPDAGTANIASTNQLKDIPVFNRNPTGMFTNIISQSLCNELLAKGIPALSMSAGLSRFDDWAAGQNVNMENPSQDWLPNGWPRPETQEPFRQRWLHSDMKDVAFYFTYKLFSGFITKGNLDEQ